MNPHLTCFRLTHRPLLALAAVALTGSLALSSAAQAQTPAPAAPTQPQAAPIERQPPSDGQPGPMRRGMRPGMRQGMSQGAMGRGGFRGGHGFGGPRDGMGAGLHIAPPGMWWKNPMIVQRLTLTPDQVTRMDAIFQKSRIELIDLKANVEKQEVMLEPLLSANPPDATKAMAQIDKAAQARADLEKADARMLLGIRGVLTPDQWTKLHARGGFGAPGAASGAPAQPGAQTQSRGPGGYGGGGYGGRRGPGAGGGPSSPEMDDTRP